MIQFIKNISIFSLLSILAYMVLVVLWGEWMPTQLRPNLKGVEGKDDYILQKYLELKEMRNLDVLFVGSSHAYRSFDSRIWEDRGYEVYNIGTSSQTHIHTGMILREFVPTTLPKLVIYEVYPDIFANEGVESTSIFLAYGIASEELPSEVWRSKNIKSINELIHAKYKTLVRPNERLPIVVDTAIKSYRSRGFVEKVDGNYKEVIRHKNRPMKDYQIEAFYENLNYLETMQIPVILVHAPVTSIEAGRFIDQDKYDVIMSDIENFVDMSQLDFLVDSLHFYDYHHLNQRGVEIFNPYFINWLESENIVDFEKN